MNVLRISGLLVACVVGAMPGLAQTQTDSPPGKVTLCDIFQYPAAYIGKVVRVRATVATSDLSIDDFSGTSCSHWTNTIVVLPDQVKPRSAAALSHDDSLTAFSDALHEGKNIEATFTGTFDAIFIWHNHRQLYLPGGFERKGFGKKHHYGAQIVLQSVSDVVARDIPHE